MRKETIPPRQTEYQYKSFVYTRKKETTIDFKNIKIVVEEKPKKKITNTMIKSKSRRLARGIKGKIIYCEKCGSDKFKIEIHHKDRDALNNDIDNLVGLCQLCHYKEHENEPIARIMIKRIL